MNQQTLQDDDEELKMENPFDYVTREDLKRRLGIGDKAVDELIRNPYFPSIKLGKALYVVPKIAFIKFITSPEYLINYKQLNIKKDSAREPLKTDDTIN